MLKDILLTVSDSFKTVKTTYNQKSVTENLKNIDWQLENKYGEYKSIVLYDLYLSIYIIDILETLLKKEQFLSMYI